MKKIIYLIICVSLFGESIYNTKACPDNKKAMENKKVKCRWVCDKKVYKAQKIADAISFYKNSKDYNFVKREF